MIENLPLSIVAIFIMSTLLAVGIFQYAAKKASFSSKWTQVLSVVVPFQLIFQATVAVTGFYRQTDSFPPRLVVFGIAPALLTIIALLVFAKDFTTKLPLQTLTIIHVVRLPIEWILHRLYQNGQIPQAMTYEGANFDVLAGITAPVIGWLAFRGGKVNRPLLLTWNVLALALLLNIVAQSLLAYPSPVQQTAFDQSNRAVAFFPFVWLPTVIVPVILFAHLASLRQLWRNR